MDFYLQKDGPVTSTPKPNNIAGFVVQNEDVDQNSTIAARDESDLAYDGDHESTLILNDSELHDLPTLSSLSPPWSDSSRTLESTVYDPTLSSSPIIFYT